MGRSGVDCVVVTCEHGGNGVPHRYARLFRGAIAVLETHRAWDIGALPVARAIAESLRAPLHESIVTRLLIDLNRSLSHPACFSEFSTDLGEAEKRAIVRRYYTPYRAAVESRIRRLLARSKRVLHISVHSFTPVLDGVERTADVGLLYDPARWREKAFCALWRQELSDADPALRVRRNYPYQGRSDGLATSLRAAFGSRPYLGIELELNQALLANLQGARRMERVIIGSLRSLLGIAGPSR